MIETLLTRYDQFLTQFPADWHGPISFLLLLIIAGGVWHALRKNGLWLVLLIVLVPAAIPILRTIGQTLLEILRTLFERASL